MSGLGGNHRRAEINDVTYEQAIDPILLPFILAKLNTFALVGIDSAQVEVEVEASTGLPKTVIFWTNRPLRLSFSSGLAAHIRSSRTPTNKPDSPVRCKAE